MHHAKGEVNGRCPSINPTRIDATVRRQVHRWLARARVTTFVGIIAGRQARAELEQAHLEAS